MSSEIAVIIPCYNQGSFLLEALKSLEPFDDLNLDIIIVNDGSNDHKTIQILDWLGSNGKQILHKENGGVASARNLGVKSCNAPFFIPLDADNLLYLPYLTAGLDWMKKNPSCAVVYGDARIFGEKDGTWCNHPLKPEEIVFENYIDNCALIRKSAWEKVGGYDTKVPVATREDYILWLDFLKEGFDFHYLNEFCFAYRYLENSKVRQYFKKPQNRILIQEYIFRKQFDLICRYQDTRKISDEIASFILGRHYTMLANGHLRFGDIRKGLTYLQKAFQNRVGAFSLVKSLLSAPYYRFYRINNSLFFSKNSFCSSIK